MTRATHHKAMLKHQRETVTNIVVATLGGLLSNEPRHALLCHGATGQHAHNVVKTAAMPRTRHWAKKMVVKVQLVPPASKMRQTGTLLSKLANNLRNLVFACETSTVALVTVICLFQSKNAPSVTRKGRAMRPGQRSVHTRHISRDEKKNLSTRTHHLQ